MNSGGSFCSSKKTLLPQVLQKWCVTIFLAKLYEPRDSSEPLSNFTFSTKEAQPEEDPSVAARLQRLQNNYEDFGMRRTVEGILVVHDHGHPHILMLQIANAFFKLCVILPSSYPTSPPFLIDF